MTTCAYHNEPMPCWMCSYEKGYPGLKLEISHVQYFPERILQFGEGWNARAAIAKEDLAVKDAEIDHLQRQLADMQSGCCDCSMFKDTFKKFKNAEKRIAELENQIKQLNDRQTELASMDEVIYGSSFVEINQDGNKTRIDPTKIVIETKETLESKLTRAEEVIGKLEEALKNIEPNLEKCAKILRKTENASEAQRIAEHDACLVAIGFLKMTGIDEALAALAAYRKGK